MSEQQKRDDGGAAFPRPWSTGDKDFGDAVGATMRDYFAAAALTGLLACYAKVENQQWPYTDDVSEKAYSIADAMLETRKREDAS